MKNNILSEVKKQQLPVIISGAGIVGEVLLAVCNSAGIKVECFCDSSEKIAGTIFCDMEVIYTPELKKKYEDAIILISVAAIKDVVDLLRELGFPNLYAGGLILKDFQIPRHQSETAIDYKRFAIDNCITCHDGYLNPDHLFLRSIDLIITERCSLRCRDCSNFMQYYKNPKDSETGTLLKSIDVFCSVFDEVMDFRVIGGETFMNKSWPVIVQRLIKEPKAKRVVLYTNGTIIPKAKDIRFLKNDKVIVIATNYGASLSKKITQLRKIFENNHIHYYVLEIKEWIDCASVRENNRSADQLKDIFKRCCAKNMATLSDGKLFRCPYSANIARLSAAPDFKGDYIDLFSEKLDSIRLKRTREKVKYFLHEKSHLKTCDFCDGRPLSGVELKPAVQARNPLPYAQYSNASYLEALKAN